MNVQMTFRACLELLEKQPKGTTLTAGKTKVDCAEAYDALNRLTGWCFPGLNSDRFEKVVRCQECEHYRKFRKKGAPKKSAQYLCAINKSRRDPNYFCADGRERSTQSE